MDGIRKSKTVDGTLHEYVTLDRKVVRETIDAGYTDILVDYFYDNEGKPYKITVDVGGAIYEGYYVLNQQGDVIAILDKNGNVVVEYTYNAWGEHTSCIESGVTGSALNDYNALKYRGYYYDEETGFYYVSSRYYDPVIGRFINADTTDVLTVSPTALTDKNLYAYCDNNPVVRRDGPSAIWETVFDIVSLGASIMVVATNPKDPWAWSKNPETGEKELKEVVQTFVNETDELVHVLVDGEEIITTPEHPFFAPCKGWVEAVSLRAGDILVLQSGAYVIVEKVQHEILEAPITVYNFEVEDFHTYYVCESSVLVHNMCNMSAVPTIELTPTHALTNSRSQMRKLVEDIKINGIMKPVKYVSFNGSKYIVNAHHRVEAAKRLKIYKVPAIEVTLPYKGYKTTKDLFWW